MPKTEPSATEREREGLRAAQLPVEHEGAEEALRRALDESNQRQAEVVALLAGAHTVLEQHDFMESAQSLYSACKNLIGATGGYVALLSEDGTENKVLFLDSGGMPCAVDPTLPMPIRGLRAESYRAGTAVYENNFPNSAWVEFTPEGHVALDNVLFAPMVIRGKAVGLLGLANKPRGFSSNDARIASAFGELTAIALLNAQARESLESSEARLRSIVQTANDAIISADSKGSIVFWNQAAQVIFGHSADEAIGRPLALVIPKRFREAHQIALERVVATGESRRIGKTVETSGLTKDGREVPLECSVATWNSADGVFFTALIRDITERKRAEEEVKRQQEVIRELSTPVLPLSQRLLIVPLIGSVDARRARQLTEQLLRSIRSNRAKVVVIDITGVATMDTAVANHLIQTTEAARLLGARVILTGMSREIAHTLVTLGVDLGTLKTMGDLQSGIEEGYTLLGHAVRPAPGKVRKRPED